MDAGSESYTAKDIQVLAGLEGVRRRPAMYIGDTGKRGLHHLIYEIVDNSLDEALAGFCKNIEITLHADGSVSVKDDGRGIPTEIHPQTGKSALEIISLTLHAGAKFEKKAYQVSGGLHGVGASVVNALSESMEIEVHRNGKRFHQSCARGKLVSPVKELGPTQHRGTIVRFKPDPQIFSTTDFDYEYLRDRFLELAFLNSTITIRFKDEHATPPKEETYHYEGGLTAFVEHLNKVRNKLHAPFFYHRKMNGTDMEFAIQYTDAYTELIHSFVNDIRTIEGGTHLVGFKTAITRALNEYTHSAKILKDETKKISGDDAIEGMTAVISVKIPEPQFEGQTKTKLGNSEVKGIVDSITYDAFLTYLNESPDSARKIAQKVLSSLEAREAAQKAKDLIRRKNVFETSVLPGKLADCESEDPKVSELYIVEGDSAGGCFAGDTKIALADGRRITFKQLVEEHSAGKRNFCYTIKDDGTVAIEEILHPRITRKDAEVIRVVLDDGFEVVCTPDHKFMTRNGGYTSACELSKKDSLMPFHTRISKIGGLITINGYEMVWDQHRGWVFTHMLADGYNLRNGICSTRDGSERHHVDFNKRNNNPTNLVRTTKDGHLKIHHENVDKYLHTEEARRKCSEARKRPEFRKRMSEWAKLPEVREMLSKRAKKQWAAPEYKRYMTEKFMQFYNNNSEYRKRNREILNANQKEYWSKAENKQKQSARVKNYFQTYPEKKTERSRISKEQWKNGGLLAWRSETTKKQWTPEFRKKRMDALNKTYYKKTIAFMKIVLEEGGKLDEFDVLRIKNGDRTILSMAAFADRFFNGDLTRMEESARKWNHKVKRIEKLQERMDVYDIEVPDTHNFALASGVFVHNSLKMARDRRHQAVLPLRGKILNVEKAPINKILTNEEIKAIILSLGTGFGEDFDVNKIRYHKIVIATDADVDGSHIRTLLLTLFYRYFKPIIEQGYIYIATPPLYKIWKGKQIRYAYSDAEKDATVKEMGENPNIQRYKGLGEMNPEQLWETTINPENRTLKKVTIEDAMKADELFDVLMGEAVEPRRKFIEDYAREVKNLDV